MDDATRDFFGGLKACFRDLEDPRVVGRCDHRLLDIIAIAILAVLCGAEDSPDIELSAKHARSGSRDSFLSRAAFPRTILFGGSSDRSNATSFLKGCFGGRARCMRQQVASSSALMARHAAIVRQEIGQGDAASGDRLGEREWSDARASGLRGEVQRDHRYPGTAEATQPQRLYSDD